MLLTCPAVMLLPGECWKQRERRFKAAQATRRWRATLPPEERAEFLKKHRNQMRSWRQANRQQHLDQLRQWREKNREKLRAQRLAWLAKNPDYAKKKRAKDPTYQSRYTTTRKKRDPVFRLTVNLRRRVLLGLQGRSKSSRTEDLLGCSFTFLRFWLESKFLPNMSWENYGDWHVDHIRPLASFDLTDPKQQALAFHFLNLQPLWAKDNLSKGAKILDTCGPSDKGVCATVESHGQLLERAALESL